MQEALYRMWFPYGLSITLRYCDDRQVAVAALHDAFLAVYRNLDRYDRERAFKPWFRIIVVRAALDTLRKHRKFAPAVELHPDHSGIAREDILSRIGYDELLGMVRRLTTGYRTVFNLYVIDGFKHEEIAEQLGISVGTSKSNLHKARTHLRRMIEESLALPATPATARP